MSLELRSTSASPRRNFASGCSSRTAGSCAARCPSRIALDCPTSSRSCTSVEPVSPDVQLFDHGRISEDEFTRWAMAGGVPRRCLDERFRSLVADGATLVLNSLEAHSACRAAAERRGESLSPAFPPARTPMYHSAATAASAPTGIRTTSSCCNSSAASAGVWVRRPFRCHCRGTPAAGPGRPHRRCSALDALLEAGDVLYLPRGWWHEVTPLPAAQPAPVGGRLCTQRVRRAQPALSASAAARVGRAAQRDR